MLHLNEDVWKVILADLKIEFAKAGVRCTQETLQAAAIAVEVALHLLRETLDLEQET
jgi:hypothetical protein